ncbi:uncharacterized protein LOC114849126 isoform X2 [Betta splendens]|uniref:Glycosyltransferase family 92 protein n=1 Tax=Betta splendens TaxID=158456 RepID=A0A6P7LPD7_BETSP|nr:uncharacterized protein LOC114849126 isoform X2 [Betta splendens]
MDRTTHLKGMLFFLFIVILISILIINISDQTITPLDNTKHFVVSAFMDQRVKGFDIRIISIFKRDSIQPLHCLFCCADHLSSATPATVLLHSDHFGFPFGTTDVMCQIPHDCSATHVALLTQPEGVKSLNQSWMQIKNRRNPGKEEETFQLNFTVCISNLFGKYNNVLQFAQTLEIYRLLGVDRVVIYNTSCGPELNRLLHSYSQEGFVEMVPWPIDKHLNPSHGWQHLKHEGDLHYFGQLTTLNECIYRSMERSRYVLLNDIDEIIMPYQHDSLTSLMDTLQTQHPNTGVFLIENHIFPRKPLEERIKGPLPQWSGVSGFNILQNICREEPDRSVYHPHKMIIQPRLVEQTSVHEVLKMFGEMFKVPLEVCRIIHHPINIIKRPLKQLHVDTRLWDFKDKLIPRVNKTLRKAGLLSTGQETSGWMEKTN